MVRISGKPRRIAQSPSDPAEGPPFLWVYILPDESTLPILRTFHEWTDKIDEATADIIHVDGIGNPKLSGMKYQAMRDIELTKRDAADALTYENEIQALGDPLYAEGVYFLRNTKIIAKKLKLRIDQLPCLAFCTRPDLLPPTILPISTQWSDTDRSRRVFLDTLTRWFVSSECRKVLSVGTTVGSIHKKLARLLARLSKYIDQAITRAENTILSRPQNGSEHKPRTQLSLEALSEGKTWHSRCARIVGTNRFAGLVKDIGTRELFFLYHLFRAQREEEVNGRLCAVISEQEGIHALKKWASANYIRIAGRDSDDYPARFRKMWYEFVRQMGMNQKLHNQFFKRNDDGRHGESLYGIRLSTDECCNCISDLESILAEVVAVRNQSGPSISASSD